MFIIFLETLNFLTTHRTHFQNILYLSNEDLLTLFDKNPKKYADANLISEVTEINEKITGAAGGTGSRFGTGGMATKIKAMDRMINEGRKAVLANGKRPSIIFEILNGKQIGTLFHKK